MTPRKLILPPFSGCICRVENCTVPYGLCHCGCGRKTSFPRDNDIKHGSFFGVPRQFISGHSGRIRPVVEEAKPFKIDGSYCRLIALSKGLYAIVDVSMYDHFMRQKYMAQKTRYFGKFYAATKSEVDGTERYIYMHREVLGLADDDKRIIDHKNGNGLDNRFDNLRIATQVLNGMNGVKKKNNTSGFKGVCRVRREGKLVIPPKWFAQIQFEGKNHYLGQFSSPESAHKAYCDAAVRLAGEFANFG